MNLSFKTLSLALTFYSFSIAHAHIFVDHQVDPVPLVSLEVNLPQGFVSKRDPQDIAALSILGDLLDSGSQDVDRVRFQSKLGDFAANYSFSASREYSTWSLNFPYSQERNFSALIGAMKNNWTRPRFLQKEFDIAKQKLLSQLRSQLDSDQALLSSFVRKTTLLRALGLETFYMDDAQKLQLSRLPKLFEETYRRSGDLWVAFQGPKESLPLITELLESVFPEKGKCVVGTHRQVLEAPKAFEASKVSWKAGEKYLLLLDRKERAQLMSSLAYLVPSRDHLEDEKSILFGNFLNVENSLGSLLPGEIRVKRGLAYAIWGVGGPFYGLPYFGFVANPQTSRADEFLDLLQKLREDFYKKATIYEQLPKEQWSKAQQSFLYSNLVGRATPSQQLALRGSAVRRQVSWDFVEGDLKTFLPKANDLAKMFQNLESNSIEVIGIVGDMEKHKARLLKLFPEHKIVELPYEKSIYRLER